MLIVCSTINFNKEISFNFDYLPEVSKTSSLSKEKLIAQFNKTGDLPFYFSDFEIDLEESLFMPVSVLNEIRRTSIEKIQSAILDSFERRLNFSYKKESYPNESVTKKNHPQMEPPHLSLLLNILNLDYDYSKLNNVAKLYIPLKYFGNVKYKNILELLSNKFDLYIYLPTIIRKAFSTTAKNIINNSINTLKIKGIVISNIGELDLLPKSHNLDLVGNYTLNVYNNISSTVLNELNLNTITISPELDEEAILNFTNNCSTNKEMIVSICDEIHEMIGEKEFTTTPTRGQYYLFDKSQGYKTQCTLFPCPSSRGKGSAVTPTVGGNLVIGPDSEKLDCENYATTSDGLAYVKSESLRLCPSLDYRENIRNFAGLRAKTDRNDFIVEESKSVKNFFNLAGISSPGLSSAPAIGKAACEWVLSKETFDKKDEFIDHRKRIKFMSLSDEEKNDLIKSNPSYGRIICRCESITEGEILETFNTPIPPCSIDGVKRRVKAGMGRCQGGFCGERVAMILKNKLNLNYDEILQDKEESHILMTISKGGEY